jgi:hypothetical protein
VKKPRTTVRGFFTSEDRQFSPLAAVFTSPLLGKIIAVCPEQLADFPAISDVAHIYNLGIHRLYP